MGHPLTDTVNTDSEGEQSPAIRTKVAGILTMTLGVHQSHMRCRCRLRLGNRYMPSRCHQDKATSTRRVQQTQEWGQILPLEPDVPGHYRDRQDDMAGRRYKRNVQRTRTDA